MWFEANFHLKISFDESKLILVGEVSDSEDLVGVAGVQCGISLVLFRTPL